MLYDHCDFAAQYLPICTNKVKYCFKATPFCKLFVTQPTTVTLAWASHRRMCVKTASTRTCTKTTTTRNANWLIILFASAGWGMSSAGSICARGMGKITGCSPQTKILCFINACWSICFTWNSWRCKTCPTIMCYSWGTRWSRFCSSSHLAAPSISIWR